MRNILGLSVLILASAAFACDRSGGTSKSGPGNQTVDSDMKVHRDSDGSVTGSPGVSPYEGITRETEQSSPRPQGN